MSPDFKIHDKINITLSDLGLAGCLHYLFNKEARMRVKDLLHIVTQEPVNQDQIEGWLKKKLPAIDGKALSSSKTPLEIASSDPEMHQKLMADIHRQIYWPGVN
ncbi:MAG TPA: hypothetical protein VIF12_03260 [Micavibrio sp.]